VYVAFVIDVFARHLVGWRAHTTMRTDRVLDALEQARPDREPDGRLMVHSDRGSRYVAMRYTTRVVDAGAAPSAGSAGDAYDNALAEASIGLYQTEVIHRRGPWRGFEDVEYATLEWVARFNTQRILDALGIWFARGVRGAVPPHPSGSYGALGPQLTEAPENPGRFKAPTPAS
jgi:putative transposase